MFFYKIETNLDSITAVTTWCLVLILLWSIRFLVWSSEICVGVLELHIISGELPLGERAVWRLAEDWLDLYHFPMEKQDKRIKILYYQLLLLSS